MKKLRLIVTVEFEPVREHYNPDESALEVERQQLSEVGPFEYLANFDENEAEATIEVVEE